MSKFEIRMQLNLWKLTSLNLRINLFCWVAGTLKFRSYSSGGLICCDKCHKLKIQRNSTSTSVWMLQCLRVDWWWNWFLGALLYMQYSQLHIYKCKTGMYSVGNWGLFIIMLSLLVFFLFFFLLADRSFVIYFFLCWLNRSLFFSFSLPIIHSFFLLWACVLF